MHSISTNMILANFPSVTMPFFLKNISLHHGNTTPWLWESQIYTNICMNLAILSEFLALFSLFLG